MYGRKRSIDDYIDAIAEHDRPALTKQDIADAVGVSRQTVHNHAEELEGDPRVESGQIGKATVYWLAREGRPDDVDNSDEEIEQPGGADDDSGDTQEDGISDIQLGPWEDVMVDIGVVGIFIGLLSTGAFLLQIGGIIPTSMNILYGTYVLIRMSILFIVVSGTVILSVFLRYWAVYYGKKVLHVVMELRRPRRAVKRWIALKRPATPGN